MIKIRIVFPRDDTFPESHWWCPVCNKETYFYSVPPTKCLNCQHYAIPNLRYLKESREHRISYHKEGKT